jgi:hypothetical protein
MRKVLGLGLALSLTLTLSAAAEEAKGKVKAVDPAEHSFVLEDGTKLWVSDDQLTELTLGEQVLATYELRDGKRFVTDLDHRTMVDGQETTNFGSAHHGTPIESIQAGD